MRYRFKATHKETREVEYFIITRREGGGMSIQEFKALLERELSYAEFEIVARDAGYGYGWEAMN